MRRLLTTLTRTIALGVVALPLAWAEVPSITVGTYPQEVRTNHDADAFPSAAAEAARAGGVDAAIRDTLGDANAFAQLPDGRVFAAHNDGLMAWSDGEWSKVYPEDGAYRWAPSPVAGVSVDGRGRLWFASPQGAGVLEGDAWTLYTGYEGLPYNDMTCIAAAGDFVWIGTRIGAIRFDGTHWAYRQGKRWVPDDHIEAIVAQEDGGAWILTPGGAAHIEMKPMTLAEKAAYYDANMDKYNKRTEYNYVLESWVSQPGDLSEWTVSDSDNDGLWTAMYGAANCYAYAATGDPEAKRRATEALEALLFLHEAPQNSVHPPQPGFFARTVIPTTEPDPNLRHSYTVQGQAERRARHDSLWRVYEPRFVKTTDGAYWWKSDTSSDEVDGHYYLYALYYDLVAETEEEKARVRDAVVATTDHLLRNGYDFIDWNGEVTRWGIYNPRDLNHEENWWPERYLKSLSMLSYLNVALHMTDDLKYAEAARELREIHGYHTNAMRHKLHHGVGSGNQSDDEMAVMCYYNLIRYERDPQLRKQYLVSFLRMFMMEEPESNPFFNFAYAAVARSADDPTQWETHVNPWTEFSLAPWDGWLEDSVDTLKRFPLDRFSWGHRNSHRLDIVEFTAHVSDHYEDAHSGRGLKRNGKVIPVDENHFNHWNTDQFRFDFGGDGRTFSSATVYTLPYFLGLYYGFIE